MSAGTSPKREQLLDLLRARPGSNATALARDLRMDDTTVSYHLRRLEREGLVSREDAGRELVWFASGTPSGCSYCPVLRKAIPLLRRDAPRAVATVVDPEERTVAWVARLAGVAPAAARRATVSLETLGLVARGKRGRVRLAPGAATCVALARAEAPCNAWGACAVSRAWEFREAGR